MIEDGPLGTWTATFCGRSADSPQTYLTRSRTLNLYANPASETDHLNAYFDVLSTEALRKRYPEMARHGTTGDPAVVDNDGRCDVLIRDCPDVCRLSSPMFPISAVPRNVTCRYRIQVQRNDWQLVIGGQPGDRYDLSFHPECQADRLIIYEKTSGGPNGFQQVAKFCGRGNIPKAIYFIK